MLSMILVIITAKFTLNFPLGLNKFSSMDHLNGNFNNLILKNNAKILTFSVRCGPPRKQCVNI